MRIGQTRRWSLIESITNVVIGLGVALLANAIYFSATGYAWTWHWMGGLAVWMTIISIIRSYFLRRFFNWLWVKYQS